MWIAYKYFFDKKINDGTIIVLMVGMFVALTGFITPNLNKWENYLKADLIWVNKIKNYENSYIYLDWKKYKIYLDESR